MLDRLLHRVIDRAFRPLRYDATYVHDMLATSRSAFLKFLLALPINLHRRGVPLEAWYAAKIAAARAEDCGPCAQLVVDMALKQGVTPRVVSDIVMRSFDTLPADAALGLRFAEAVIAQATCDELREAVVRRFGRDGLLSLAFGIAHTRTYPAIKRALGHAHACERLRVEAEVIPMAGVT